MPKSFIVFCFLFFYSLTFAQTITLKGKVIDKTTQMPIESATVFISTEKDSSVVDYTITDKLGNFNFKTKKLKQLLSLKVSYASYEEFKINLQHLEIDKDFGILALKEVVNNLKEVVIKREVPPIRIKKDTLEFNASSFKVRPDSNVETLLKQLPGVEITPEGKITVNGKEVNQILVNGKPFFDKDGKVALQNLPSEIINKVQISDTKTKKEELSNQAASGNSTSINLTIDEDKNKGLFAKFTGGYGSSDRYESSALVNYFKNKRKISVLASSNNINSVGFSMDEIFDNMGGGRSSNIYSGGDDSFVVGNTRYGGGKGITKSNLIGVSYADEWTKKLENTTNYFFSNSINENSNITKQVNFLPDGLFTTSSGSKSKTDRFSNNANLDFEYKIDSTATLSILPKFSQANSKEKENSFQSATDENEQLLNENTASVNNENDVLNFNNEIYFNKAFRKKGRNLSVVLANENYRDKNTNINKSVTAFYQDDRPDDIRNQEIEQLNLSDSYRAQLEYAEPIKDSLGIRLGMEYENEKLSFDTQTFDFDSATQTYSVQNDLLTNYISSSLSKWSPKAGVSLGKKNFNGQIYGGTSVMNFDNHSLYLGNVTDLNKSYIYPFMTAYATYKVGKSKSIWFNYSFETNLPTANQLLPVANLANPLNTFIGNPNLNPNENHYLYMNFSDYDYATRSGYSFYAGANYDDNQVVTSVIYDDNKKQTTTYQNVDDTYNSWLGGYWSKSIKKDGHKYSFSIGVTSVYGLSKGFTNGELYEAHAFRFTPRLNFNYEYGELLTINPSYNYTYTNTKYSNYTIDETSNFVHRFNIQTTNYWPKNWVFGNDFGYTYNSNISDGFKKDFYLWNTSLGYNFYNKKFTAKIKVYDVLNQNQSATRYITPSTVRDEQNTVLKRYLMFSVTYKIEKFAGKVKQSED